MTDSEEIVNICAGFSSVYDSANRLFASRLPPEERDWSSHTRRPNVAECLFDGEYIVDRITALEIGSDQTTDGLRWEIKLRHRDGGYSIYPVHRGVTNIRRGAPGAMGFSVENDPKQWPLKDGWTSGRAVEPSMDFVLPLAEQAVGGQLLIVGHGWFRAVALAFHGERCGDWKRQELDGFKKELKIDLTYPWDAA